MERVDFQRVRAHELVKHRIPGHDAQMSRSLPRCALPVADSTWFLRRKVLVQCTSEGDVDQLFAPAYSEDREMPGKSSFSIQEIQSVPVVVYRYRFIEDILSIPCRIHILSSSEQYSIQAGNYVFRSGKVIHLRKQERDSSRPYDSITVGSADF